jgi:hypothetical protein
MYGIPAQNYSKKSRLIELFFFFKKCFSLHDKRVDPPRALRTEVYFCHQNQNAKNIGNFTTLLKPHNIGTHLKGIDAFRW